MIPPVDAIRRILWGNIILNNNKVPVLWRDYPYDKTPCVTIDASGSSKFLQRHIMTMDLPLDSNHPQYDNNNPEKLYPQQVLRETFETTVNINSWSDSVSEREELDKQITSLFHMVQSDHYLFCENYHDGECKYLNSTCPSTNNDSKDKRIVKQQCPSPSEYGYNNIFNTYDLDRHSFYLDPPFTLNDYSKDNTLYRSVFKLHTGYYLYHIIGGVKSLNITSNVQ